MHGAAFERVSKNLFAPLRRRDEGDDANGRGSQSRQPSSTRRLGLAEGWFSLFCLALVVYSSVWSIQAANWVDHLNVLSLTTTLGLVAGVVAAKVRRRWRFLVAALALSLGLGLVCWQTAGVFSDGNVVALLPRVQRWLLVVVNGGIGDDTAIFLFFIVALSFLLAYISAWLVYAARRPWAMILVNGLVLLLNLSNMDARYSVFLIIFLGASLLLLLRLTIYESVVRWQHLGLRYGRGIGWDMMQVGVVLSLAILLLAWLLPWGYINANAAQVWDAKTNSWAQAQNTWNRVISLNGGVILANHGNFREALVLAGNPNLNHDVVLKVQTEDDTQYLASLAYDTYTGKTWTDGPHSSLAIRPNQVFPSDAVMTHSVKQKVTVVNPPGEQEPYLLGASAMAATNVPTAALLGATSGDVLAWVGQSQNLTAGMTYTVVSQVSSADVATLKTVPLPVNAPKYAPNYEGTLPPTYYSPGMLRSYLQVPPGLDPQIAILAEQITANASTMYEKVVALESYLRTNYSYSVNVQVPPGEEAVSWFLFRSDHKGFCNYFATSMAIMARSLGIPARVVVGYANGEYDEKQRQHIIHGTDAHSWTQVYFAGYGWINFEPSASFAAFARPLPNQFSAGDFGGLSEGATHLPPALITKRHVEQDADVSGASAAIRAGQAQQPWYQSLAFVLVSWVALVLCCCLIFGVWWHRLFRRYDRPTQVFGRISLLASWAGIRSVPSQTPYEYIQTLSTRAPAEAETLKRLGDIYVRARWADPSSREHPRQNGELAELARLWKRLRLRWFLYVLRHPHFLHWLPEHLWHVLLARRQSRGRQRRKNQ